MKLLRRARVFLRVHRNGQSLIEVLVALAIGVGFIIAAVSIIAPALRVNKQAGTAQTVAALSQELSDNIFVWKGSGWNNVASLATSSANQYYLNTSVSPFTAVNGVENVTVGSQTYQRYFYVSDAYRDTSGNVTSTSGGTNVLDPSTKLITVTASAVTYDGTLGAWSTTAPLTLPRSRLSAAAYNNGYFYKFGGWQGGGNSNAVEFALIQSNGSISNWSRTTDLPTVLDYLSAAAYNGYVYTTGGNAGGLTTSTVFYAPVNSTGSIGAWSTTTALPSAIDRHSGGVYNGYIYTVGGYDGTSVTSTVFYAPVNSNGSIGSWSTTTALPSVLNFQSGFAYNGYLYEVGGQNDANGNVVTSTVYYAPINSNGSIGSWSTTTALPSAITQHAAVANNGYMYSMGGQDAGGLTTSTVQYAPINSNGSIGAWSAAKTLPSSLQNQAALVYNGYNYTIGGADSAGTATSTVFYAKMNSTPGPSQTTSFYVTRNANNVLYQADWSGGSGQTGPSTSTNSKFSTSTKVNASTTGAISISLTSIPCLASSTGALSNWSNTTALPSAIFGHSAVVNNGYIYATGGEDSSSVNTSTVFYAPINSTGSIGSWSTTTALPSALHYHSAVVYNGYIYTTAGSNGAATSTVFYAPINSNGSVGNWTSSIALPSALYNHSAVVYNGYIYTTAGSNGAATSTVNFTQFCASGPVSNWTSTTALPSILYEHSAVVNNGYIYTVAGSDAGGAASTVNYAPINSTGSVNNWSSTTALPRTVQNHSAVVNNGYIYTIGGDNGSSITATSTVQYAPINSTGSISNWTGTTALPSAITKHSAVVNNGYVYVTGGNDAGGVATSTVLYTKPNSDGSISNWTGTTALPSSILWHSAVVNNGYIYTIGGSNNSNHTSTVLYARLNANGTISNWSSTTALPAPIYQHSAVVNNGYIYTAGGYDVNATSTVLYAPINSTGSIGSWATTTPLPSAIFALSAVVNNGYIYTTGGKDSTGAKTSTVFYAPIKLAINYTLATGTLDSTVYDTGITTGAQLNSVLWQGTQPAGTTVAFQFATSNSSSGPWSFIGSDGTGNTFYTVGPNTSKSLDYSLFNNFRYFQVHTKLTSDASGTLTPTVNDVIVNWSP